MNYQRLFKNLVLVASLAFVLTIIGWSMHSPLPVQASGNGEFEIAVWSNGTWQVAGALPFDQFISQQQIDLSSFALTNPAQVRVAYKGTNAAHIDTVTFGGNVPTNTQGASESPALVAKKLAQRDYDVIDASGKSFIFTFPANGSSSVFSLVARIEAEQNPGIPFQFPTSNVYGAVDSNSQFYAYRLNSVPGALKLNGDLNEENLGDPFFKEWSQPVTGHPANFTYGWVLNDVNNLYVAIEFAPDNTYDGDKDFTAVFVKTANGVQRFKVSVPEQKWGVPGFVYTDKAVYQHKVYEYKIPLAQIGFSAAQNDPIELAFEAYGTAGVTSLVSSMNPSTFGQNVTFTATAVGIAGPVAFMNGGVVIPGCGAVALVGSSATCSTTTLPVGSHIITANAGGGPFSMTGNPQVVNKAPTTTTLTGPSGNFTGAQSFTFTATVTETVILLAPTSGGKTTARAPAQTGTVTFFDNGVAIPTCTNVPLVGGVASCTVTLGVGTHVIRADYSGDANFAPSTSTTTLTLVIAQTVTISVPVAPVAPKEVPEGDTLLLLGGGIGGLGVWLRWQWSKRRKK